VKRDNKSADIIKTTEEKISSYIEHYLVDKDHLARDSVTRNAAYTGELSKPYRHHKMRDEEGSFNFFFVRCVAGVGLFPNYLEAGFTYS
jgi:hypothetical protein